MVQDRGNGRGRCSSKCGRMDRTARGCSSRTRPRATRSRPESKCTHSVDGSQKCTLVCISGGPSCHGILSRRQGLTSSYNNGADAHWPQDGLRRQCMGWRMRSLSQKNTSPPMSAVSLSEIPGRYRGRLSTDSTQKAVILSSQTHTAAHMIIQARMKARGTRENGSSTLAQTVYAHSATTSTTV